MYILLIIHPNALSLLLFTRPNLMKTRLYIVLCIAFIIQMAGVLPLQAGHYYYKQISLKEGLPSTVRCILTDEQGFVWIGTRSGLGRFDGHELKKYTHQANDPHLSLIHI